MNYIREQRAEDFKLSSGRIHHTNTCSTSIAPAEEPEPCDCAEDFVRLYYPKAVLHLWNGPHGLQPRTYQIYPNDRIFRAISDLDFKTPDFAWESAANNISARMEQS